MRYYGRPRMFSIYGGSLGWIWAFVPLGVALLIGWILGAQ